MSGILQLPAEILFEIFILSSNENLPIVCRQFHHILYHCSPQIKMRWLCHRHPNLVEACKAGLRFPFFTPQLLERFETLHQAPIPFTDDRIPSLWFRSDDLTMARLLLGRGASPNKPFGYPLIKSAQLGRLDMVQCLIEHGADPTARNNMALRVCAARNNFPMVNYFLDVVRLKPDSESLKVCVKNDLWDMAKVLVDHGAVPDLNTVDCAS